MKWAEVSWSFQKRWRRNSTTERTVPPSWPLWGKPRLWSSDPGRTRKIAERGVYARKGLLFLTVGMVLLLSLLVYLYCEKIMWTNYKFEVYKCVSSAYVRVLSITVSLILWNRCTSPQIWKLIWLWRK